MKRISALLIALVMMLTMVPAMAETVAELAAAAESLTHDELVEKALAEEGNGFDANQIVRLVKQPNLHLGPILTAKAGEVDSDLLRDFERAVRRSGVGDDDFVTLLWQGLRTDRRKAGSERFLRIENGYHYGKKHT